MRMTARRFALFSTTRLGRGAAGGGGGVTTAAPTTGAHRYWRINISASTGSASSLLELEFWKDGSTKHATATPIASATGAGGSLAAAFDGLIDAGFWWSGGTTGYIGMDFGAGNAKEVGIISIVGRQSAGQAPDTFTVDYSDDGAAWTTAWTVTGVGAELAGSTKKRFYMEPAAGFRAYRARFASDGSGAVRITAAEFRQTAAGADVSSAAWYKQTSTDVVGTVADIFDGNQATAWAATVFPAWVSAYFPDNRTIAQLALTTITNADQTQAPDNVYIDWTSDGFNWTNVYAETNLTWTTGETKTFTVPTTTSTSARYWRVNITAFSGAQAAMSEIEFAKLGGTKYVGTPSASSFFAGGFEATKATNGNGTTDAWVAANGAGPHQFTIDYGVAVPVNVVRILPRSSGDGPTAFDVQYSSNGSSWTTAWSVTGAPTTQVDGPTPYPNPTATSGLKPLWRLNITTTENAGAISVTEVEWRLTAGGLDLTVPAGKAWAKDTAFSDPISLAFDDNTATIYHGNTNNVGVIGYEFFDSVTPTQLYILPRSGGATQGPKDFTIQSSADGITWTTRASPAAQTGWTNTARTFTI